MCTVVCRWSPGATVHLLAVRDEFVGREFDGPARWWPQQPDVIGGRDRQAGGTWCACDLRTAAIAVVLNRPDRPQAQPGAASRGVLPLLALSHGTSWPERLDLAPMASFNLMLVTASELTWWTFDGDSLLRTDLTPGVHMAKPRGLVDSPDPRLTDPDQWRAALAATEVRADPSGLLVRVERGEAVYASVFAQFITATPGFLTIDHSRTPRQPGSFEHGEWRAALSS
jgi:uncharacterized protein with NRDE domain